MITITQPEMWAFNVLSTSAQNAQQEAQRALSAREAYIKLLESKYNASFDISTGTFKPNKKESK